MATTLWAPLTSGGVFDGNPGGSGALSIGNQFAVSQSVPLTGIWWWSPSGSTVLPSACAIYNADTGTQVAGTLNSAPSWSGAVGSGWVKCTYDGTINLSSGTHYMVVVFGNSGSGSVGWFGATNGYWTTGTGANGLTSGGVLSAPSSAASIHGQSAYSYGSSIALPTTTVTGYNFWVDVEVSPSTAPYSLWSQASFTQSGSSSASPFTLGNHFTVSQAAPLTGIWWPTQGGQLPTECGIFDVATSTFVPGTHNTSPTWGAAINGWQKCSYDGSITLQPGHDYVVAVYSSGGGNNWYPVTNGYWTTGAGANGIANGVLSAPSSAAASTGQSVYHSGTGMAYPATTITGYNFWVDVEIAVPVIMVTYQSTDGNNIATYSVTSAINSSGGAGAQSMRVLTPTAPSSSYPHAFLWMLPVEPNQGTTYGDSIGTALSLGAHNQYNLTCIQPGYAISPWYADNPTDPTTQQETFLLKLVTWANANLATTGREKHYLIGFSKSGIGGQGLLFRHSTLFAACASWDAPFMMTSYDGQDPNGTVGGGSAAVYGTNVNFVNNYQLSVANLTTWGAGFTANNRIWISGYASFQADVTQYDARLTSVGIQHTFGPLVSQTHAWSTIWVAPALSAMTAPSRAGLVMASFP